MDEPIRRVNPAWFLSVFLCNSSGEPFHFCVLAMSKEREMGKEVGRQDKMNRKCTWNHLSHYSYRFLFDSTFCILKAGLRTVFRLQIWQMSVVVSAKQKMICPLSSLCPLLSLSLCFPEWWPIQNCSRSHRTEHPSVSTSRPASLCKLREMEWRRAEEGFCQFI